MEGFAPGFDVVIVPELLISGLEHEARRKSVHDNSRVLRELAAVRHAADRLRDRCCDAEQTEDLVKSVAKSVMRCYSAIINEWINKLPQCGDRGGEDAVQDYS